MKDQKEKNEISNSPMEIDDCWNQIGVWSGKDQRCERLEQAGHCRNCPIYGNTGRNLLNRPLTPEYRKELVAIYEKSKSTIPKDSISAMVFNAGGEWLALPSSLIHEIVDMGPIHSIPHKSSRIFRGIVNIRGKLELCVSLGGVLRIENRCREHRGFPTPERLIVANKDDRSVVFPVTEVLGTLRYTLDSLTPLPVTVSGSKAVYTKGVLNMEGRDIGLLDDKLLFRILTRNLA